jgi:hypothetical protein
MDASKRCWVCGELKPLTEFYRAAGCVDGRRGDCRSCFQAAAKARKEANPELKEIARQRTAKWITDNQERYRAYKNAYRQTDNFKRAFRKWHLKTKYGLTPEQYEEMLERQGGGCAICGTAPGETALHVDHCHETGRVRGLLCFCCNAGLGQFKHDPDLLYEAMAYAAVQLAHRRTEARSTEERRAGAEPIASPP